MPNPTLRRRLGNLRRDLLAPVDFRRSVRELFTLLSAKPTGASLWSVTQRYSGHGWFRWLRAWQVEAEYCRFVDWAAEQRPRVVVEIGTHSGGTLLAWARIATQLVVSIDLPGGIHGGGYPAAKRRLFEQFARDRAGVEMRVVAADSQSPATRQIVERALGNRTIDLLFIDGDHTYAGVARDFALWSPLVTPQGFVAFHDILHQVDGPDCEVDRLWAELKPRFPAIEIVANYQQGWAGIGIVQMPAR